MSINFKNITVIDMGWEPDQYPEFEDSFIIEAEFKDTGGRADWRTSRRVKW